MNKILVIDSGSSKTDWAFIDGDNHQIVSSSGINPSSDIVLKGLEDHHPSLISLIKDVQYVHYYGAGVIDTKTSQRIVEWLLPHLGNNTNIEVQSDLLGACKSSAGDRRGIVSILGTGSNSCTYDGSDINDNIPAMGFALSNEGSGTDIGKAILQDYFYRKMPEDVLQEFENQYSITKSDVVNALYQKSNPTKYLASYASFINKTSNKKWRKSLLIPIFQNFVDVRIKAYEDYLSYELYFIGSIAYFCQDILKEILENNNLQMAMVLQKPITGLINYHT